MCSLQFLFRAGSERQLTSGSMCPDTSGVYACNGFGHKYLRCSVHTCNVTRSLYEWQLSLTNIYMYEHINTKMSCSYLELQQVFEG